MTKLTIRQKPFFSDNQLKRYLAQIMACFAGYRVRSGKQRDGEHRMISVPVMFGDSSRVVTYAMAGGNENTMMSLPAMAVDMIRLQQAAGYRRAPQQVERLDWVERSASGNDGSPGSGLGAGRAAERYMPVPYDMGIRLNIWASNNDQGFQLLEQILAQYNPEIDIQLSNSPMDWTFMTTMKFDGQVNMGRASSGIGEGKDDQYYVYSLDFSVIIHMSPPAKVFESKVIETIHTNIKEINASLDFDTMDDLDTFIITETGVIP